MNNSTHHHVPLSERVRPSTLSEVFGQVHLLGDGSPLQRMLQQKKICSLLFWGGPGTGKTTIAKLIAQQTDHDFFALSAATVGVSEIRKVIEQCESKQGILFLDEMHRFNKSQQDVLLQAVEQGKVTLIGATTENPSFEINNALLSRLQVFVIKPLEVDALMDILQHAIQKDTILRQKKISILSTDALFAHAGGDARKMLNVLDMIIMSTADDEIQLSDELVQHFLQRKIMLHDKAGDNHYDIISAFIKSIRGSDPNAALYWFARMLLGGEDIVFIARRLVILASEDIGLANPNALIMANATFDSVHKIGMPEARIILANCIIYLACSEKSNAAYVAVEDAIQLATKNSFLPVPLHLRNAPTSLMKKMNFGKDYKYVHDYNEHFVETEYFPDILSGTQLYHPQDNARENVFKSFLQHRWNKKYK